VRGGRGRSWSDAGFVCFVSLGRCRFADLERFVAEAAGVVLDECHRGHLGRPFCAEGEVEGFDERLFLGVGVLVGAQPGECGRGWRS